MVIFRHKAMLHLLQLRRIIGSEENGPALFTDPENLVKG